MIQKSLLAVSIVFLLGGIAALAADNYKIDPAHSSVMFSVKHMVISNVKGRFPDVSGTILYDEKDVTRSSVTVAIKSASIDTTIADRDKHLRSADFLDVEKYPEIIFKSARIVKKGHGLIAVGNLTLRGVTREITIPFTITGKVVDPYGNTRLGVEGSVTINRMDYGVAWSKTLDAGGLVVGNDVKIDLEVEAIKEKGN